MANGTEGWIPTQYLSTQPVARDRLAAADRRVDSLEAQLKTLRTKATARANDLAKQTDKLQTELAEVRRISATSIANYEENKQLKASNETLQKQVTQLTERVRQLERNVDAALDVGRRRPGPARIATRRLDQVPTQAQQLGVS